MRLYCRKKLIILGGVFGFVLLSVTLIRPQLPDYLNVDFETVKISCVRPKLDVNDPQIAKFFTSSKPIECDREKDWVCIEGGKVHICSETLQRHQDVNCNYTFLKREGDFSTVDGEVVQGHDATVELKADFFKVSCQSSNGTMWSNIMAGIRNDSKVHSRATWDKLPPNSLQLNVLMWGFDSLSRNTFIRKLPKTYSFLTKQLGAIVLQGYNIVGDGTPQALIPILTGQTEPELPETRKRMKNAKPVNIYPFVWKEYQEHGYVTAYAEDCPSIGTFTYRLTGFSDQPTDHFMRAFHVAAEKQHKNHKRFCLRNVPRHKVLMNWVRQYFSMYSKKPKFMFTFHSELSHDDFNLVGSADDDLQDMLKNLKDEGHLNNTLLIVMSDHGHRFAKIREYQQGKQEERLPFFSFTFPPWFEKKYPQAMANFRLNAERLTTPFDIYPTLRDVLHSENIGMGSTTNRSISLFTEVPATRSCLSADIEPHWCTCLEWEETATDDAMVLRAAKAAVKFMNNLTEPQRKLCQELALDAVKWAGKYTPTTNLMKFNKNADLDGFKADLSAKTANNSILYQVKVHTKPGDGHFEASLKYDVPKDVFTVKEQDISRTNRYGRAADCVAGSEEQLRKFCYCKNTS